MVDKRYFLARLALDAFFDPYRNSLARPELASKGLRRFLCNALCDLLDEATIVLLAAAIREKSLTKLGEVGIRIASLVALHPADDVARWADALHEGADDPDPLWSSEPVQGVVLPTPNPTMSFYPALQTVSAFLAERGATGRLVCDEELTNGPSLAVAFDMVRDGSVFLDGASPYGTAGPMSMFTARTSADSRQEPGIQFADFAAGLAARLLRTAIRHEPVDPELLDAWEPYRLLLKAGWSWWEVRDSLLPDLERAFAGSLPRPG
jgi:hypothetical protein